MTIVHSVDSSQGTGLRDLVWWSRSLYIVKLSVALFIRLLFALAYVADKWVQNYLREVTIYTLRVLQDKRCLCLHFVWSDNGRLASFHWCSGLHSFTYASKDDRFSEGTQPGTPRTKVGWKENHHVSLRTSLNTWYFFIAVNNQLICFW